MQPYAGATTALTDDDLVTIILTALPPSFDVFISSIVADPNLKSADLIRRILQEDGRRNYS